jgi:17beta-estradiol 17-dehydrogenase / very-long-chain 3-oxoacyl-CoA reductase
MPVCNANAHCSTEAEYQVHTKVIEADFTNDSPDTYHAIEKELYGLEIGILINNVGTSYPHPAYFLELPNRDKLYSDIVSCNISSVINMTTMILPQMVERKKGVVVNVSSTAAIIPSPLLIVYASSKVSVCVGECVQVSVCR